jgi:hypothetical protein
VDCDVGVMSAIVFVVVEVATLFSMMITGRGAKQK